MADLTSPNYAPRTAHFGNAGSIVAIDSGAVAIGAGNLTVNSLIKLFQVKKGFCVTGALMEATDMDTNGSPALAIKLGDSGDDDRFIAAASIGQAGGVTTTLASAGAGYVFTADTDIYAKVSTAAATAAAGTLRAALIGYQRTV